MQAEKAAGSPLLEPPDEVEPLLPVVVVAICATPTPDEPSPHPAASAASNAALAPTTARAAIEALLPLDRLRRDTGVLVGFTSITPWLGWKEAHGPMDSAGPVTAGERKLLPGRNLRSGGFTCLPLAVHFPGADEVDEPIAVLGVFSETEALPGTPSDLAWPSEPDGLH
jgi:hypothetical protein